MTAIDETNNHYGRLTVLRRMGNDKRGGALWLCQCSCGKNTIASGTNLRSGGVKSCGCLRNETASNKLKEFNRSRALPKGAAMSRYILCCTKGAAKRRKLDWSLSDEKALNLMKQNCYYCGVEPRIHENIYCTKILNGTFPCNGIDRVDNKKGYLEDNVVPCCSRCNFIKRTLTLSEFRDLVTKIYKNFIQSNSERIPNELSQPKNMKGLKLSMKHSKNKAKYKHLEWSIPEEKAINLMTQPCYYCGAIPQIHKNKEILEKTGSNPIFNGIDRMDNSKGYIDGNIVPCCSACNYAKGTLSISEFKEQIAKIYKYFIESLK